MAYSVGAHFLEDAIEQLRKYKKMADAALAQVQDEDFFRAPDPESNSVALVMKHLAGNMRSRWRDFLVSDGEKPDRHRDSEFERDGGDTRETMTARWEEGWALTFGALEPLREGDLLRTVPIRGMEHTVLQAIQRQLTHYAYHIGQIVFLAKHFAGARWKSLSIPKGKSREFDVARNGTPYTIR
ncbi:MAG TPA: DUF1572 family protein [Thermoanaerobaculia bacterium]|jgi:hypothetical protein